MRKVFVALIAVLLFACVKQERSKAPNTIEQPALTKFQKEEIKNLLNSVTSEKIASVISVEKVQANDQSLALVWYLNEDGQKTNIAFGQRAESGPDITAENALLPGENYSVKCVNSCNGEQCYLIPEGPPPSPLHCSCTNCKMVVTIHDEKITPKLLSYANNN